MQHDDMIWQIINHQFCSYKTTLSKTLSDSKLTSAFCKHPYSTTGICNRSSCPLANSKYATIREEEGRIHLYIKTVERAHSPKNLWEKIYLSRNYSKAMEQLDEHLAYFPKAQIHRNKQRLTKIHQYLLRMRKLKLRQINGRKANLTRVHRKVEQREERREKKALVAAKIEQNIEKELMERLAKGTYGDIYNFPEVSYQKALEKMAEKEDEADESEEEEELETEDEEEEEEEMKGMVEYVEDLEEEDEEDLEQDMEDVEMNAWDDDGSEDDSSASGDSSENESGSEEVGSEQSSEERSDRSTSDDTEGNSDDEEERRKKRKKSNPRKPFSSQHKRGVRVEIEYEDENEAWQEENAASKAGLAW